MQTRDIKDKISIGSVNQILKEQLFKDKYVKTALYFVGGVITIAVCGHLFKVLNFTISHYKNLSSTLKR